MGYWSNKMSFTLPSWAFLASLVLLLVNWWYRCLGYSVWMMTAFLVCFIRLLGLPYSPELLNCVFFRYTVSSSQLVVENDCQICAVKNWDHKTYVLCTFDVSLPENRYEQCAFWRCMFINLMKESFAKCGIVSCSERPEDYLMRHSRRRATRWSAIRRGRVLSRKTRLRSHALGQIPGARIKRGLAAVHGRALFSYLSVLGPCSLFCY